MIDKRDTLVKKISLLLKFREYLVKNEVETENFKDIIVIKSGETEKILIHIVYVTPLISGKVGVQFVRKMKEKMDKEGYESGILIGMDFSYSAKREAEINNIEMIQERRIPTFNIFDHHLVPKHLILSSEESEELLKEYHVEPHHLPRIKASDPAVFLIGGKPGDIVRITRESPTSGIHITYRHVV
jgi:DNA-directed RNA polymerase subunit H (RpoH/RPB5)